MSLFLVALAGGAVTAAPGCCFSACWQSTEHSPHAGLVGRCAVVRGLGKVQLRTKSSSVRVDVWNKQAELLGVCPPCLADMVGTCCRRLL